MINKLLITCLQRNKRLVLPTLGAFIRKNIDGVGVVLVFVPFLHKDDGVLHAAIKSWAGVEDDEATQILTEYISAIKRSLDERGKYNIEGVGILKYDINNIISLAKEEDVAPMSEASSQKSEEVVAPKMVEEPVAPTTPAENVAPSISTAPVEPSVPIIAAPAVAPTPSFAQPQQPQQPQQPVVDSQNPLIGNNQYPYVAETEPTATEQPKESAPTYNQSLYQKPTDMGARYFSPERDYQTLVNSNIDRFSKGGDATASEPKNRYEQQQVGANTTARADVSTTFNRQRQHSRISDLYESKNPSQSDQSRVAERGGSSREEGMRGAKPQPKRRKKNKISKNNDIVLIIAVVAIILTVIVLIYGYMHGGEQSLDALEVYDPVEVIDNTSSDTI